MPAFHLSALAVGGLVLGSEGNAYTAGALAELDIFRFGAFFAYDRGISSAWSISDTQQYTGMLGYSLFASNWGRVRVLGGVNVLAATTGVKVAPVLGTSARVGWHFLALELSAAFTPAVFRELDARAALVLCAGAFEVRAGYRARVADSSATGTLSTLFASPLAAGPFLAFGFTL